METKTLERIVLYGIGILVILAIYVTVIRTPTPTPVVEPYTEIVDNSILKARYETLILVGVHADQHECGCIDLEELTELVENKELRDELFQQYEATHGNTFTRW